MQPEISVIIPVYNGEKYLRELIAQFRAQQPQCFELVFVDDGSADETYARLQEYQAQESFPITVFHQENKGVSAARNQGMDLAKGKYITFVDVDDAISADYMKTLSECAQQDFDIMVFASQRITQAEAEIPAETAQAAKTIAVSKQDQLMQFLADPTKLGIYNLLLKTEYVDQMKIRYAVGYKYYEDYDFLLKSFAQTEKILRLDRVLYYYILREGSAMGRFTAERINCLQLMKEKEAWLAEKAPGFAPTFRQWGVARLYWSVLWQAALALPTAEEFKKFAEFTGAKQYLNKIRKFPDRLVQLSTVVFLCSSSLYRIVVRAVGKRKSKVEPASFAVLREGFAQQIDFYRD